MSVLAYSFDPSTSYSLAQNTTYGSQPITFTVSDPNLIYDTRVKSLAFVESAAVGAAVLADNATLFPGVTINGVASKFPGGGENWITLNWIGTPTASGTFYFYLRARAEYYVDDGMGGGVWTTETYTQTFTVSVSGTAITITPGSGNIQSAGGSNLIQGSTFISAPFTIANGSGSYNVQITGPWTGSSGGSAYVGLNDQAVLPSPLYRTINIASPTFYVVSSVPTAMTVGTYPVTLTVIDQAGGASTSASYDLVVEAAAGGTISVSVTPAIPPDVLCIDTGTYTFTATGGTGTYNWSYLGNIPGGTIPSVPGGPAGGASYQQVGNNYILTLNKPMQKGIFNSTVYATDGVVSGSKSVTLNVQAAGEIVGTVPSGTVGTVYNGDLYLIGSRPLAGTYSYTWSISNGNFPPGLSLGSGNTTNTITGTPTQNGTYTFEVSCAWNLGGAPDSYDAAYAAYTVIIGAGSGGGLTITSPSIPTFTQLSAIAPLTFTASGGTGALTWSVVSGTLPTGLALNQVGNTYVLSGTPTLYTPSTPPTISIQVTDSSPVPKVGGTNITITVNPNLRVVGSGFADGNVGSPYDSSVTIEGCDPAITGNPKLFYDADTNRPPGIGNVSIVETTPVDGTRIVRYQAFSGLTQAGTYNLTYTLRTTLSLRNNQQYTQTITDTIIVAGSNITITPANTTVCAKYVDADSYFYGKAVVTGGTSHQFKLSFPAGVSAPSLGSLPGGYFGPVVSDELFQLKFTSAGSYTVTYTSIDDPGVTATTVYTLDGTSRPFSASPSSGSAHTLYAGQSLPVTVSMPNGCHQTLGKWALSPLVGTISPSPDQTGGGVTYVAPAVVNANTTVNMHLVSYTTSEFSAIPVYYVINLMTGSPGVTITTSSPLPNGEVGTPYAPVTFGYSGATGTAAWSSTTLPAGLTLNPTSGVLQGTPTVAGTDVAFTVTVTVTPAGGGSPSTTSKQFLITILPTSGTNPTIGTINPTQGPTSGGTSITVTGTNFLAGDIIGFASQISITSADCTSVVVNSPTSITCVTPAWSTDPANSIVDVYLQRGGSRLVTKSSGFTYNNASGGLTFTSFNPISVVAGTGTDLTITVTGSGFNSGTVVKYKPYNTGWVTLTTLVDSATTLRATLPFAYFALAYAETTAQLQVFRASDSATVNGPYNFSITANPLSITTSSLPAAERSQSYSQTLAATGGVSPYTWSLAAGSPALPTGLTLSSAGVVFGTVDAGASSSTPVFKVTDSSGTPKTATKAILITVSAGALSITTNTLPDATNGTSYSFQLIGSGGTTPYTWSGPIAGSLPTGLSISSSGLISGTPNGTANSQYTFTVRLTDSTSPTPVVITKQLALNLLPARSVVTVDTVEPAAGPTSGLTSVTITGTGFMSGCTVKFGTIPATNVTYISSTRVTCVSPPGAAGTVAITVTNPDLGFGTKTNAFTYSTIVSPIITSVDKQDGPFEGGQIITLYGSNFNGVNLVAFGLENTPAAAFNATGLQLDLTSTPQKVTLTTPAYTLTDRSAAVPVNIYVTNPQGTGILAAGDTGYVYRPAPIITQVIPSSGSTSGGNTIYIIGKHFFERGNRKPRVFIGNVEVPPNDVILKEE